MVNDGPNNRDCLIAKKISKWVKISDINDSSSPSIRRH
ncbi:hypothetical protein FOXB_01114 [Fusarium oxysporum f. sp. conglutinans Fo5176]|uniref:Uncharacterized protein n=1 Tax=Fusarium oxysporum (strain Fo5176) TaxID=660025 RepID=F9F3Y9_FUSOF|nr:hypothetical protein FOXB_01114 [Fusarium oxysporum f. sp. conglutinans Fo5176]